VWARPIALWADRQGSFSHLISLKCENSMMKLNADSLRTNGTLCDHEEGFIKLYRCAAKGGDSPSSYVPAGAIAKLTIRFPPRLRMKVDSPFTTEYAA